METKITQLTARQLGLVTRQQLTDLDVTRHGVAHLVDSGQLVWLSRRLLILTGAPVDEVTRALAGTLDVDGVLSSTSGAALWGAPGYTIDPIQVTRLRGGRARSSHVAVVHAPRQLLEHHLTVRHGVPVMRPHRLIFDLAATEPASRVERTLDWMWSRRLLTVPLLDRTLTEVAIQGRSGVRLMRRLIDDRRGLPAPGSNLEGRFTALAERACLPPFRRQVNLGNQVEWLGRMDFVSTTRKLVIEIDSELHHNALSDRRTDEIRRSALEEAGMMVRTLDENDLFHQAVRSVTRLQAWYQEAEPVRDPS